MLVSTISASTLAAISAGPSILTTEEGNPGDTTCDGVGSESAPPEAGPVAVGGRGSGPITAVLFHSDAFPSASWARVLLIKVRIANMPTRATCFGNEGRLANMSWSVLFNNEAKGFFRWLWRLDTLRRFGGRESVFKRTGRSATTVFFFFVEPL